MIRHAASADRERIAALYRRVAAVPNGLARTPAEITGDYIDGFIARAGAHGVELVWDDGQSLLGEIHASCPAIGALSHLLTDLTIAVDPRAQGQGLGRALFDGLLDYVLAHMPHISRVELFARAGNGKARALYRSLGFVDEGVLRGRIRNADGVAEDDTIMAWLRPHPRG